MKRAGAHWPTRDRHGGFTLLEVLVALVIIGVALAAAMRGAMALTHAAEDARLKLLATLTAENRLLELRLARQRLELGQANSECEQGGWVFICEQTVKSTPNPFFRRVELQVFIERDGTRRRLAEMMTVLPTQP
ncbi:MAG: type II secretion system minor pseudopilin GspI [Sutterellaceae bacterium]|nr:type II secretion system minor pseudopilin GspI [Burkholderiaceae bacterium]MCX7901372.1 type II secretion system minor pseudopilin GspI [Burkholderiaceae bacterium]MDW8429949.1 type II secretion system minor pseudopilin GspI [Sutterellaceae bacterium]